MASGDAPPVKRLKIQDENDEIFMSFHKDNLDILKEALYLFNSRQSGYGFVVVKIKVCDAASSKCFSSATCDCEEFLKPSSEPRAFKIRGIFQYGFKMLEAYIKSPECIPQRKGARLALAKLLKFLSDIELTGKTLSQGKKDISETEWTARVAHHLFSKLAVGSNYILDNISKGRSKEAYCNCGCNERLLGDYGDTSMGKGMLCTLCMKHQSRPKKCVVGRAVWVDIPCTSLRRYSCSTHQDTDFHKDAVLKDAAEAYTGGGIEASFSREKAVNRKALKSSMTLLYFLCKEELPHHSLFKPLIETAKHLGVDVLNFLEKGGNANYTSNRHIHEVVILFRKVIWEELRQEIIQSPSYSVMVDETTDISTNSQLVIYVRYIKDGTSKTVFGEMVQVPNGRADTIYQAIITFLGTNFIPLQKMIAFGSDGAAVMVGRKNGVSTKLQAEIPHLLVNHCVAHRLALASAQAAAKVPYLDKFKKIIEQLYRFYSNSGVRTATLREIQSVLNLPCLKLKEAKDVRWLSHDQVVRAVRQCLPAVVTSLEFEANEKSDAVAQGLSVFVQKYEFVAALYMMSDVLPVLSTLSRALQTRDCPYSQVGSHVAGTIATVKSLRQYPGEYFRSLPSAIDDLVQQPFQFKQPTETQINNFRDNVYNKFIDSVVKNLEKRFPHITELEAFGVFNPQQWPEDTEMLEEYGSEEIQMLADRFSINKTDAQMEFRVLKNTVMAQKELDKTREKKKDLHKKTASGLMEEVTTNLKDTLPRLCQLATAGLLIPASTADCERGFSTLNRVKTSHRNRLGQDTLNALLMVTMEGPAVSSFGYEKTLDLWCKDGNRRLEI